MINRLSTKYPVVSGSKRLRLRRGCVGSFLTATPEYLVFSNFNNSDNKMLSCHRDTARCFVSLPTGLPAGLHACRYCLYWVVQKWAFRPAEQHIAPSLRYRWNLAQESGPMVPSPMPNFTFIGSEMWEYSPKNGNISNFAHKFGHCPSPSGATRLHNFYEILTVCTRL